MEQIRGAIAKSVQFLNENPDKRHGTPPGAVAVLEDGLRCRVDGPGGVKIITDMPAKVGGQETAPSPGWYLRGAHAACDATMMAVRDAQQGISLAKLVVAVDSEFDNRGMIGADDSVPPWPLSTSVAVRISASGLPPERLREFVSWAEAHSPVGDTVSRAVPGKFKVEII